MSVAATEPRRLEVSDLLAATWQADGLGEPGWSCATLAWHVLTRERPGGLGWPVPLHAMWAGTPCSDELGDRRLDEVLAAQRGSWEVVGREASAATEIGDLVEQRVVLAGRTALHLLVMVDLEERTALSIYREGARVERVDRIPRVRAVYRWRGPRCSGSLAG